MDYTKRLREANHTVDESQHNYAELLQHRDQKIQHVHRKYEPLVTQMEKTLQDNLVEKHNVLAHIAQNNTEWECTPALFYEIGEAYYKECNDPFLKESVEKPVTQYFSHRFAHPFVDRIVPDGFLCDVSTENNIFYYYPMVEITLPENASQHHVLKLAELIAPYCYNLKHYYMDTYGKGLIEIDIRYNNRDIRLSSEDGITFTVEYDEINTPIHHYESLHDALVDLIKKSSY